MGHLSWVRPHTSDMTLAGIIVCHDPFEFVSFEIASHMANETLDTTHTENVCRYTRMRCERRHQTHDT